MRWVNLDAKVSILVDVAVLLVLDEIFILIALQLRLLVLLVLAPGSNFVEAELVVVLIVHLLPLIALSDFNVALKLLEVLHHVSDRIVNVAAFLLQGRLNTWIVHVIGRQLRLRERLLILVSCQPFLAALRYVLDKLSRCFHCNFSIPAFQIVTRFDYFSDLVVLIDLVFRGRVLLVFTSVPLRIDLIS